MEGVEHESRRGESGAAREPAETSFAVDEMFVDSDVLALDNIRLELPYAGAGSRLLAGVIDYTLFYGLSFALAIATVAVLAVLGGFASVESLGGWAVAIALLLFFLLEAFWFAGQEILLGGQTLGKRVVGLRTVAAQGHPASAVALLLRNLIKMLDILVGCWFLVLDRRSRRLGDRLAGTVVLHEERSAAGTVRRVPSGWGPEQVRVVEELLDRLYVLDERTARSLSERMLDAVASADPSFLEAVPADLAPSTRLAAAFGVLSGDAARDLG